MINFPRVKVKTAFVVGTLPEVGGVQPDYEVLRAESLLHNDILLTGVADSMSTVTVKVLSGLWFARQHCASAELVLVADDDAVLLPWNFLPMIFQATQPSGLLYAGFFRMGTRPVRDIGQRWSVSQEDYLCRHYPPYALGSAFVMSKQSATLLFGKKTKSSPCEMFRRFFKTVKR